MDRENTQSFPEDKSVQESSCIVYAQLEEISLMFVTITEFSNQTWNDQENLNESAAIENISSIDWRINLKCNLRIMLYQLCIFYNLFFLNVLFISTPCKGLDLMKNENFHCKYHKISLITLIKIRKTHANFSEYSVRDCTMWYIFVLVLGILLVF